MMNSTVVAMVIVMVGVILPPAIAAAEKATSSSVQLDMRPIEIKPEPVGELHPKWRWLKERKVRGAWMGDNLAAKFPGTDKTKGDVLVEAGFNLVWVAGWLDRKNRDVSPYLEKHLPGDVKEARRVGIRLLVTWQYGTNHHEPYRKYRTPSGILNELTCCPLDHDYIERHIGRWAVGIARGGADGMLIDTEMYGSDQTDYLGPCVCDDCFATYLKNFAQHSEGWQQIYDQVPAERRGPWLSAHGAGEHYGRFQTKRIIALYDSIRQRCQAINPAFIFAHAPGTRHQAIIMRGLGTSSVPCLAISEREYSSGPTSQSYAEVRSIRKSGLPVLYLPGLWCSQQTPEQLAENALASALYTDGWWLYYAEGILTHPAADDPKAFHGHGRVQGTSARDYLDRITAMHQRLDELLEKPQDQWPKRKLYPATPSASVLRRKGKLTIDGQLDEPAWRQATRLDLTLSYMAEKVGPPTTMWVCWDDEALYVAARCRLPKGAVLQVPERGRDNGMLWRWDGIEIFLDPNKTGSRYAQFMISALGDVFDSLIGPEPGTGVYHNPLWNSDVQVAATSTADEYVLELRIAFKGLASTPKTDEVWAANFCRFLPALHTWSPTYGGFHSPARFGTLRFVDR